MNTLSLTQFTNPAAHRTASARTNTDKGPEIQDSFTPGQAVDDTFLNPKSVVVVGGSDKPGKPGTTILGNLLESFQGETYVVNTRGAGTDIQGKTAYASVKDLPDGADLAVITVPGKYVEEVVKECADKGIKNAVVISAGFGETPEMEERAESLKTTAKELGVRLMGPNCLGLINAHIGLNATFAAIHAVPGSIAFLSQSGGELIALAGIGQDEKLGFSVMASMGNKMDLQETDMMKMLEKDGVTKVVGIYAEGIQDGEKFMKAAAETAKKMPVVMLKGGISASGAKAASSHTGSLAGQSDVFDAAMEECGVIQVRDEEEMVDLTMAFSEQPIPKGRNLAIITNGGGPGIIATDNGTTKYGLKLASLDDSTQSHIKATLPPEGVSVANPVDVRGDAGPDSYATALEASLQDPNVDMAMVVMVATGEERAAEIAQTIADMSKKYDKPITASFMSGPSVKRAHNILRENGVPSYKTPTRAARALGAMADYAEFKARNDAEQTSSLPAPNKAAAASILEAAKAAGREKLSAQDCVELFEAYNIPIVRSALSQNADESVSAAEDMGYPVVMKLASEDVVHKKDIGGVILNLKNEKEVREAHQQLLDNLARHKPEAKLDGIQVMQMAEFKGAREMIAGLVYDSTFGSTLMAGEGGSYVEVRKDKELQVCPVSPDQAKGMLQKLVMYPILEGTRGEAPSDVEALSQVLARVSELGADFPEIKELDINPFLVYPDGQGVIAVDGRVTLRDPKATAH